MTVPAAPTRQKNAVLAARQESRLVKLLARADIVLFIVAVINLGSSWMSVTNRTQAMAAANGSYFGGWFSEINERFGTPPG